LAGVAPGTLFLAGVTGLPLADQRLDERAGLPGSDGLERQQLLTFYWCFTNGVSIIDLQCNSGQITKPRRMKR
jgi:hypothetical protein